MNERGTRDHVTDREWAALFLGFVFGCAVMGLLILLIIGWTN